MACLTGISEIQVVVLDSVSPETTHYLIQPCCWNLGLILSALVPGRSLNPPLFLEFRFYILHN
jgi:hypothetical protein